MKRLIMLFGFFVLGIGALIGFVLISLCVLIADPLIWLFARKAPFGEFLDDFWNEGKAI